MVPLRLLSFCVNDMSIIGALESFGGLIFVFGSSVVIGRVVPVVLPGDATVGFGVGCMVTCSDGVAAAGVLSSNQLS